MARPPLARVAFIRLAGFVVSAPFSISISQLFVFTAVVAWVASLGMYEGLHTFRFPLWKIFLLFAVLTLASAFHSPDHLKSVWNARQIFQIMIFYLALNVVREDGEAMWLVKVLFISTGVAALYAIISALKAPLGLANRMSGFFSIYMTLGGFLLIVCSLALTYLLLAEGGRRAWWVYAVFFVMLAAMLATLSRNAWVGFAVVFVVIAAVGRSRKAGLLLAVGLVFLLFLAPQSVRNRIRSIGNLKDTTTVERLYMWRSGVRMVREKPLLGFGPGQIKYTYHRYANPRAMKKYTGHLHNNMLHIAAERGLLAFAAWLAIWIGYFILVGRRLLEPEPGSSFSRFRCIAGLAAVAGFLSAGMFEFNFGDSEVAMMLYFAMALPFMAEEKPGLAFGA